MNPAMMRVGVFPAPPSTASLSGLRVRHLGRGSAHERPLRHRRSPTQRRFDVPGPRPSVAVRTSLRLQSNSH